MKTTSGSDCAPMVKFNKNQQKLSCIVLEIYNFGDRLKHIFLTHPDADHINHGYTADTEGLLQKIYGCEFLTVM